MGFPRGGCDYLLGDVDVAVLLEMEGLPDYLLCRRPMLGAAVAAIAAALARLVVDIAGALHCNHSG